MRAAEDRIQLFVVRVDDVQLEQHLLHRFQVLPGFFEEDLKELGKIDARCVVRAGVLLTHRLLHCGIKRTPRIWLCQAAGVAPLRGSGEVASGVSEFT